MKTNILVLILSLIIVGCTFIGQNTESSFADGQIEGSQLNVAEIIAENLVPALLQLDEVKRRTDAVKTPMVMEGEFPVYVIKMLRVAGYKILRVGQYQPENALKFAYEKTMTPFRVTYRYSLGIGTVSVERDYEERSVGFYPRSKLRVTGSQTPVFLNDEMFLLQDRQHRFPTGVEFIDINGTNADSVQAVLSITQSEPTTEPNFISPGRSSVVTREVLDSPALRNAYILKESNFQSTLDRWILIDEDVVIFANDSMRMGQNGKLLLQDLVTQFEVSSDVVHVMGCSHGNTQLVNGNEELSKGRVLRVAQELYILGVAPRKVLAEGCWSPTHFDEAGHPRRGVMVRIYRPENVDVGKAEG